MELSITRVSSDTEFVTRRIRAAVSIYVLDHLMSPTRLELLENMYGGQVKAHQSATIIQRCFRNYRSRKNFEEVSPSLSTEKTITTGNGIVREICKNSFRVARRKESSVASSHSVLYQYDPDDPFSIKNDEERRKHFFLGINLFNRKSNKGINYLINHGILDADENSIVKFFDTKGLSSCAKGEYMSQDNNTLASATRREYIRKLSFHNCSVEKGVRKLFSHIRVPGETQKILNMIEDFKSVYLDHNVDFRNKLGKPDTVVMIAFAILMLHTSLFNPNAKKQDKMTKMQFVTIFRDYTSDPAIEANYFDDLYDSIKRQQIKPLSDHTDLVRNIYNQLIGPKIPKNFIQNHRKLVCHYQLNEIPNIVKKRNSHNHRREVFLFNDLILIAKKSTSSSYNVRHEIPLTGICISEFQTKYYPCSVELRFIVASPTTIYFDCLDEETRKKLIVDINIYVDELRQIEEVRLGDEGKKSMDTSA